MTGRSITYTYVPAREGGVEREVYTALRTKNDARTIVLRDAAPTCPFHPNRPQAGDHLCAACLERRDDAL